MSPLKAILCLAFTAELLALYQKKTNVTLLTFSNFHVLADPDNIWAIYFYSKATKNQNFAKEFALSADILKGVVRFGAIDVGGAPDHPKNFTRVKFLPAVKFFGFLEDGTPIEYNGSKTARDVVESVMTNILEKVKRQLGRNLQENLIEELTDGNFDKVVTKSKEAWMVLFYAPWCLHCKEFKPIWELVASALQNRVKCAALDATVNKIKAKEYGITEYPMIKLFPYEKKSPKHVFDYTQERNVDSIVDWALRTLPGPDIAQVTSRDLFEKHCMGQNICVIGVLPLISDCPTDCRKEYLGILRRMGEKFKQQGWGWVWTEAGAQKGLETSLGVGNFGYPALVVLNSNKMKFSVFKGAFTKKKLAEFLANLSKAKAAGVQGDVVGRIVEVKPWNEKDSFTRLEEDYGKAFQEKDEL